MNALVNMREAAALIGMSYDWLRKQVKADRVPCYRFGVSVRFSVEQVEQIKSAHLSEPISVVPFLSQPRPRPRPQPQPKPPNKPTGPTRISGRQGAA